MNKRRDSFIEFFHYNFNNLKNSIFPFLGLALSAVNSKNKESLFIEIGFYLLISGILFFSFLKWYFKVFEIVDDKIIISEGVFKKRKNDITFNQIKSINTSATIFKRMFKISDLNIEMIGGKKVVFVIKNNEIERISKKMMKEFSAEKENTEIKNLSLFKYVLITLSNPTIILASLTLTLPVLNFFVKKITANINGGEKDTTPKLTELPGLVKEFESISLEALAAVGILLLITLFSSVLYSFLTFGKFNISSNEKEIGIKYGILNKKEYHVPKKQIRSLRINEPIFYKIFGYVQLKIDNIGLNGNGSSSIILYPILKKDKVSEILKLHLDSFEQQELEHKPSINVLHLYMVEKIKTITFITFILTFIDFRFLWLFVLIPFLLTYGYISWKRAGLNYNDEFITIRSSVGLRILTLITPKKYVETTNIEQNFLMKKSNSCHYYFALYSEKLTDIQTSKYLSEEQKEDFLKYLN